MADSLITGTTILETKQTKLFTISIPPTAFIPEEPDTDDATIRADGAVSNGAVSFAAPVFLPQDAKIISVIMYGNAGTDNETATLVRIDNTGTTTVISTSAIGTADVDIDNATIDNNIYSYSIGTSTLSSTDTIYGVSIKYTAG